MRNKLIVMGITFLILIAITPLIFGKLMNSKYNQMLNDLREKGMQIKIVEDKSSYLQTDKILEVTIPSKILNTQGIIEEIKLNIETKFKNLPVTNVVFLGKLDKVILNEQFKNSEKELNKFLKKYIEFVVTTPNFRDYSYKFKDIIINNNPIVGIEHITGVFKNGELLKNKLNIKDIYVKDKKGFIEIKNFKNEFEGNEKNSLSKTNFNVNVDLNRFKLQIQNVYSTTKTVLTDVAKVNSTFGFKTLSVPNAVNADNFKVIAEVKGIETNLLKKLAQAKETEKDKYLEKIFEKGFSINIDSLLKDIKVMQRDFGGYNLNFNIKFLPTKNFREKLNNNNVDFIDAKLHLVTTPEIANILMNALPRSAFLFALAKKENGKVILNLEFKQGKLYSEGQLVK
ncbi:hypothetical protein NAMH_0334 [Nautilia profundicola AmH]|uniref:DUF945 domain-containing protein n=1 Tax=Nautilia profundicola (strain ATCC BAA-1463 / DSM 18972 / AmH) TaxID=598659 RepID=B9L7Z9_NAUPA|nr:hypothetical protein [Nautilia profundicola]ACM92831.1 hypothetical protein NAMH_0334 [Nautilia profundicola AmH]